MVIDSCHRSVIELTNISREKRQINEDNAEGMNDIFRGNELFVYIYVQLIDTERVNGRHFCSIDGGNKKKE